MFADGQPGVADLANEIALAGEQANDLVLTKPQFAQPVLQFRGGAKLTNANGDACFDSAQRANLATLFAGPRLGCAQPVHIHDITLAAMAKPNHTPFVI